MKVCQILFSGLGGHASVVFSIIEADKLRNDNSLIFYGNQDLLEEYKDLCETGNMPYCFVKKRYRIAFLEHVTLFKRLVELAPDVILLHSVNAIFSVALYSIFFRTRLIGIEHTPLVKKGKLEWIYSRIACRFSKNMIVLTEHYKEGFLKKMQLKDPKKIKVISNGIDLDKFCSTAETKDGTIGMISRLSKEKDHETLIKAFKKVKEKRKEAKLYIAGDGQEKGALIKLSQESQLLDDVHFLGQLDQEEIIHLLDSLSVYVHSSYSETMSTSIAQAMAMGKAIIACNVTGVNDLIVENETGLLFEKQNPENLAEKVVAVLDNPELKASLEVAARKYAESKLSHHRMYESYLSLFK